MHHDRYGNRQWIADYRIDCQAMNETSSDLPADAPGWVRALYIP